MQHPVVHKGGGSTRHGVADPGSNGIFKEIEDSAAGEEEPDLEVKQWENFLTDEKHRTLMTKEVHKVDAGGLCRKLEWDEAKREFGVTTASRVGLIQQERADGRKIHSLTLNLEESDGNSRAHIQEKRTLPRASDVIRSLRKVAGWDGDQAVTGSTDRQELEFARVEIQGLVGRLAASCGDRGGTTLHQSWPTNRKGMGLDIAEVGMSSDPAVGRWLATAMARLTQSMGKPLETMLQCYADELLV